MERHQSGIGIMECFRNQNSMKKQAILYCIQQLKTKYYTLAELIKEAIAPNQTDKSGKLVVCRFKTKMQHSYIDIAKEKGYQSVVVGFTNCFSFDSKLEADNEMLNFARVDADHR